MVIQKKISLEHHVKVFLVDVFTQKKLANPKLVVAFSGGLDSTVLLHLLADLNKTLAFQLSAHHVHHGLSKNADAWAEFCAETCKKLNVPFKLSHVNFNKNNGLGVEAAAREARYAALLSTDSDLICPDFICLAHHQDDQAETLLLQLARGAGVKGLAGMGAINGKLLRPLLDAPRSALEAYAKQHQLTWVEDESNADTEFDRNFMRHEVLPILEKSYPSIRQTLSRSAQHMAEANMLLDEIAADDLQQCLQKNSLNIQLLQQLSAQRINNTLRWWLVQNGCTLPSQAQLQQIVQQLLYAKSDANIKISMSTSLILRRFQGSAFLVKNLPKVDLNFSKDWHGEDEIVLPDTTRLVFSKKLGEGIALRHIEAGILRIQYRKGSETIKPQANRPTRHLNAVLKSAQMPPWQRERLPLIFMHESLVLIPNVAVDAGLQASSDEMGLVVSWVCEL
jgi:tRNA(Ile)-lysidine synthase